MAWLTQNWYWILLALGVFLLMRRGGMGCGMGGHRRAPNEPGSHQHGQANGPTTHLDGPARDPVNGHPVDQAHALTSIFDGQTYYFESEQSREEFNKDPQRFAGGGMHRHHHGGC